MQQIEGNARNYIVMLYIIIYLIDDRFLHDMQRNYAFARLLFFSLFFFYQTI